MVGRVWIGITTFALLVGKLVFVTVTPIDDAVNHVIEAAKTRKTVTMIEIVKTKEGNVSTIQTSAHLVIIRVGSVADQLIESVALLVVVMVIQAHAH